MVTIIFVLIPYTFNYIRERNYEEQTMKIVMEYGQCDLASYINTDKPIPEDTIKFIWKMILEILVSIHERGNFFELFGTILVQMLN